MEADVSTLPRVELEDIVSQLRIARIEQSFGANLSDPLVVQGRIDAARLAGVHSVQAQTAVIVRAALELLEAVDGCKGLPPEKIAAFRRVFFWGQL